MNRNLKPSLFLFHAPSFPGRWKELQSPDLVHMIQGKIFFAEGFDNYLSSETYRYKIFKALDYHDIVMARIMCNSPKVLEFIRNELEDSCHKIYLISLKNLDPKMKIYNSRLLHNWLSKWYGFFDQKSYHQFCHWRDLSKQSDFKIIHTVFPRDTLTRN